MTIGGSGVAFLARYRASIQLRQQCGEGLRFGFESGETVRLGLPQLGIVLQGTLIHRHQIGSRSRMKAEDTRNQRQ